MIDRLCEAARDNDLETIKKLLNDEKIDPDALHSETHQPPIEYAVQAKNMAAFELLVKAGAKIHYVSEESARTHIFFAIKNLDTNPEVLIFLHNFGLRFNLNTKISANEKGFRTPHTVMWWLVEKDHWETIAFLLEKVNMQTEIKDILPHFTEEYSGYNFFYCLSFAAECFQEKITHLMFSFFIIVKNPENYIQLQKDLNEFADKLTVISENNVLRDLSPKFDSKIDYKKNRENKEKIIAYISQIKKVFENIMQLLSVSDQASAFYILSKEIKLIIAHKMIASFFNIRRDDLINPMLEIINRFVINQANCDFKNNAHSLSSLMYREWRQNHYHLFFVTPPKHILKDLHHCLMECLADKLSSWQIPLPLRKSIIEECGKLELEAFNKNGFLKAIDNAITIWNNNLESKNYTQFKRIM